MQLGGKAMMSKRDFARITGGVAAVVLAQMLVASPVLAQDMAASDCVCVVDIATVGLVTTATGWVKLNGDDGLVDATSSTRLSLGSVLQTGAAGSAKATVGDGCSVDVAALSRMSIIAIDESRMCVRIVQDKPVAVLDKPAARLDPGVIGGAAAAALVGGGLVVLSLGQTAPVSQ